MGLSAEQIQQERAEEEMANDFETFCEAWIEGKHPNSAHLNREERIRILAETQVAQLVDDPDFSVFRRGLPNIYTQIKEALDMGNR